MTHSTLTPEKRERVGITDSLLRISVGVETEQDLIGDLETGFAALDTDS